MARRFFSALVTSFVLLFIPGMVAFAQHSDPVGDVESFLTAKGYTVTEAGYINDAQGNPRLDTVYVAMNAVSGDLDSQDMANQAIWGLYALRQYYPRADVLFAAPVYQRYAFFFSTNASIFDKYLKKEITPNAFWGEVRRTVRIYDLVKKTFIDEKDFTTNNQTDKNEGDKNMGQTPPNPVPTPIPGAPGKGATLWLEPSTTYLPADNKTNVVLIATLLDPNYAPTANQNLDFFSEAEGADAQGLGAKTTDTNGTARASIKEPQETKGLLLRASNASLNSQVSIVVGPPVSGKSNQVNAIVGALEAQGYTDVEAGFQSAKQATGESNNYGIVAMRMTSNTLDRAFYSQMSRAFGTVRTVFPDANHFVNYMLYRKEGHEFTLMWHVTTAYWDQFVAGKISESEFWRYMDYLGALDENGNRLDDKNFIDKSFCGKGGCGGGKEARANRSLESTLTKEAWGDQWRGQEFIILPGSYADSFQLTDLSGSATAVQIFQSPEFRTPFLEFKKGDSADKMSQWRLGQGQYLFATVAPSAPASGKMTFVEHIAQ